MSKCSTVAIASFITLIGMGAVGARADDSDRFARLDANRDGALTLAELEAHALANFAKADLNRDGKLTSDERAAELEVRNKEGFVDRDLNHDGVLERSEDVQMPRTVFYQIDADRSGGLNPNEMKAFAKARQAEKTAAEDTNGDGAISQGEALAKVRARFQKLDENRDRHVDVMEFHSSATH